MKQLNRENIGETRSPKDFSVNLGGKVSHINAGLLHTCAVLDAGTNQQTSILRKQSSFTHVKRVGTFVCWGDGKEGQLGNGVLPNVGIMHNPNEVGPVLINFGTAAAAQRTNRTAAK